MKEHLNIVELSKGNTKLVYSNIEFNKQNNYFKDLIYIFVLLCDGMMCVIYHCMISYFYVAFEGRRKAFESLHKKVSYTR